MKPVRPSTLHAPYRSGLVPSVEVGPGAGAHPAWVSRRKPCASRRHPAHSLRRAEPGLPRPHTLSGREGGGGARLESTPRAG